MRNRHLRQFRVLSLFVGASVALVPLPSAGVARGVTSWHGAVGRKVPVLAAVEASLACDSLAPPRLVTGGTRSRCVLILRLRGAVAGDVADLSAVTAIAGVRLLSRSARAGNVAHLTAVAACTGLWLSLSVWRPGRHVDLDLQSCQVERLFSEVSQTNTPFPAFVKICNSFFQNAQLKMRGLASFSITK